MIPYFCYVERENGYTRLGYVARDERGMIHGMDVRVDDALCEASVLGRRAFLEDLDRDVAARFARYTPDPIPTVGPFRLRSGCD